MNQTTDTPLPVELNQEPVASPWKRPLGDRLSDLLRSAIEPHRGLVLLVALAIALRAQAMLDGPGQPTVGPARWTVPALLYVVAGALFLLRLGALRLEASRGDSSASPGRVRWALVALAALLGAISWPRFTGNLFRPVPTLIWGAGLVLLIAAAWDLPVRRAALDPEDRVANARGLRFTWMQLAVGGIMVLGAFYRLYRLSEVPAEMGCDLPHIYNNIRLILRGEYLVFFPSFPGREGLFFYVASVVSRFFGLTHTNIKVASALVGVGTLPILYLLGKELYDREVGLYAAFFLSISHWHVILSRPGYRAILVPPLLALLWLFLVRGFKSGRAIYFALAGLCLGVGLYSYNAFMIVPLVVVAFGLGLLATGRARWALDRWQLWLLLIIVAVYVFLPLGRYAMESPDSYGYRAATRITGIERELPTSQLAVFGKNVINALLMFNVRGDSVAVANVPGLRELGFVTATLFALGMAYLVARWRRGYNVTVLSCLLVMLLPTALSIAFPNEVPNAIRAIGALPAAMLAAAVALAAVRRGATQSVTALATRHRHVELSMGDDKHWALDWQGGSVLRVALLVALVAVLGFEAWRGYGTYFNDYIDHLPEENYAISLEMARQIDAFSDDGESYILIAPYWYDGNAVRAQLQREDQSWFNELGSLDPALPPLAGGPGKFMVILHPDADAALAVLQQHFPRGIALTRRDATGRHTFTSFYGER